MDKPVKSEKLPRNVIDAGRTVTLFRDDNKNTRIEVLRYGATVLHWTVDGQEKLWLSKASKLDGTEVINGGIPLVFPRFGAGGNDPTTDALPLHGFAHSVYWVYEGQPTRDSVLFTLNYKDIPAHFREMWPFEFSLQYTIELGVDKLTARMQVVNVSETKSFDFNLLIHTYFYIPEVENVKVKGLQGLDTWDKTTGKSGHTADDYEVEIHQEFDSIFKKTPRHLAIEYDGKPLYDIDSVNFFDTVVWNPWVKVAEAMDFVPRDGFHNMLCVEKGCVDKFQTLAPSSAFTSAVVYTAHKY